MPVLSKRWIAILLLLAIGGTAVVITFWPESGVENQNAEPIEPSQDEQFRSRIVGTWQDEFKGHRELTIRADGTATMVVEPDGLNAIWAAQLTFEEEWSIEQGQLKMKAVGGKPETRVNLILKAMGNETQQKILELTASRLLLLDADGQTEYDWQRIE